MDNPNAKVRRHNSLPATHCLQRRTSVFLNSRTNPYVGWFRHSPSLRTATKKTTIFTKSLKESPYVGFLRHAPPEIDADKPINLLQLLRKEQLPEKTQHGLVCIQGLLSGHLRGGGTSSDYSFQVLSKLAQWVIEPMFRTNHVISNSNVGNTSTNISICTEDEYDDHDFPYGNSDCIRPAVVSSQAEAYYAHQMVQKNEDAILENDRLDYVITQMDIVRMNRNASRHLDVESIVKLPTTVYTKQNDSDTDESFSWMLVQGDREKSTKEHEEENNVCVICLEHYEEGDHLRILPCNHSFHVGCIDRWLSGSCSFDDCYTSGCPTCKKQVNNMDGSVPSWAFTNIGSVLSQEASYSTISTIKE